MTDFDDFTSEALADSGDIIGRETFTIPGFAGEFHGILNEFTATRDIEVGGKVGTYTATVVCELEEFDDITGPLDRSIEGKRAVFDSRTFKIERVALDSSSITLGLANLNSK